MICKLLSKRVSESQLVYKQESRKIWASGHLVAMCACISVRWMRRAIPNPRRTSHLCRSAMTDTSKNGYLRGHTILGSRLAEAEMRDIRFPSLGGRAVVDPLARESLATYPSLGIAHSRRTIDSTPGTMQNVEFRFECRMRDGSGTWCGMRNAFGWAGACQPRNTATHGRILPASPSLFVAERSALTMGASGTIIDKLYGDAVCHCRSSVVASCKAPHLVGHQLLYALTHCASSFASRTFCTWGSAHNSEASCREKR